MKWTMGTWTLCQTADRTSKISLNAAQAPVHRLIGLKRGYIENFHIIEDSQH